MLQAKSYVARHEGALQERFATSRSTKDLLTRFQILLATVSAAQRATHLFGTDSNNLFIFFRNGNTSAASWSTSRPF
jgi:hypothetical protein